MIHRKYWLLTAFVSAALVSILQPNRSDADESGGETISFNQQIRPILSDNCFHCHGPDEEDRQADLRLDLPDDLDLDEIVDRITTDDVDLRMPPPESKKSLSPAQVDLLRQWVRQGGEYEEHWSFVPPVRPAVPEFGSDADAMSAIDRFVLKKLRSAGMTFSKPADKRTLIRRLTFDLTGLPPTRDEIRQFLSDAEPRAYERLVDRLLDSPHYGEHLARYWLDLVRFADTNGLHHDHYREMTPYRDWVIRSFNDNLPFDEFVTAQIAGDLHDDPSADQLIASGFNRLHLIIDRGTALPEESFTRNVIDRVSSVGTAFLGLTLECAVCHDHKYDPITQRDFYQLFAFFNNFDGGPETGGRKGLDFRRGLQPPYLEFPTDQETAERERLQQEIAELGRQLKELGPEPKPKSDEAAESVVDPNAEKRKELKKQLNQLTETHDNLVMSIPATLIMRERDEIRPAHILVRGNYDQLGEEVPRGTPKFLPPLETGDRVATRLDLAEWLVSPDHPLTARVAVNRFWQNLFGVGLVQTSEDFGSQGQPPSHPELLDDLAVRFVDSGWDVKSLLRQIVLSRTYQQSSAAERELFLSDPNNRLLARGSRYRFDAEVIRDQVLSVSGLLNPTLYGKSVKPPQPDGLWKIVAMPFSYPRVFVADSGDKIYRRSVYSFWKRGLPPPQMTIFDAPTRESCTARRERTNTPLQALVLMNEQQYFSAAMALATDLIGREGIDDERRMEIAYEKVTSQIPSEATKTRLGRALQQFRQVFAADRSAVDSMITDYGYISTDQWDEEKRMELASMTMLVHSLLNLDAVKTRE